jgi:2-polyprenyl-3-methyl-5-hydroxy-6-metoxy-1,4-benzoquinol methylase
LACSSPCQSIPPRLSATEICAASPEDIAGAKTQATSRGVAIDYGACEVANLDYQTRSSRAKSSEASNVSTSLDTDREKRKQFDLITAMTVIEHATDPTALLRPLRHGLRPIDSYFSARQPHSTVAARPHHHRQKVRPNPQGQA